LQHPECKPDQPNEPDRENSGDEASVEAAEPSSDEEESITRDYVMSLVPRNDRPARYKAKRVADEIDSLRSRIALLENENHGLKVEKEVREKTKRRKAIPNPNAEFMTMF
jgi:hypothetical protein